MAETMGLTAAVKTKVVKTMGPPSMMAELLQNLGLRRARLATPYYFNCFKAPDQEKNSFYIPSVHHYKRF